MYSPLSSQLASTIAIILNMILFVISLKHTPTPMKDYSRIIRLHCVLDALISLKIFFSLNVSFLN
jgi:hypothetical protein